MVLSPWLTRHTFKEQCLSLLSNGCGTVAPPANPFQTADMKSTDCQRDEREASLDAGALIQENFHIMRNIYIQTILDLLTMCCSLALDSRLHCTQFTPKHWPAWQLTAGDRSSSPPMVLTAKTVIIFKRETRVKKPLFVQRMYEHKWTIKQEDETPLRTGWRHNYTFLEFDDGWCQYPGQLWHNGELFVWNAHTLSFRIIKQYWRC